MIEITFFIALLGSLIAGLWDLKTTDIPDEIPLLMASFGISLWFIHFLTTGNLYPFISSLAVGTFYLLVGWIFYKTGQWGGGDAALMGSIGYLVPFFPNTFLFPLSFFVNIFLVGAVWTIAYALVIGVKEKKIREAFVSKMKSEWKKIIVVPSFVFVLILFIMFYTSFFHILSLILIPLSIFLLILFSEFAKVVDKIGFRKTISVKDLKEGDVLADSKVWKGLTKEDVEILKRTKRKVTIKEGVRFGPVFPIALFLTAFYGGILIPVF